MLFNKNSSGSKELQELLGIYYQTNRYSVISTEIRLAEQDMLTLVGEPLFSRAEKRYAKEDFDLNGTDIEDQIVRAIQLPIAALALYRFYQHNSVSHEDEGRKIKLDKNNESIPWKWQLERDDQAMLDRYHRFLGAMYHFFEKNNIEEWGKTEIRTQLYQSLVRTITEFQAVFPIENSYYLFYQLVPFMIECQERIIKRVVGAEVLQRLLADDADNADLQEIAGAAKRCIPLFAIQTAVKRMSVQILPDAVVRRFSASFQGGKAENATDITTTRHLLRTLEDEATAALTELQKAVTKRCNVEADYDPIPYSNPRDKYFSIG